MVQHGSLPVVAVTVFVFILVITMAEPSLAVFTSAVASVVENDLISTYLMMVIPVSAAILVVVSVFRVLLGISMKKLLMVGYGAIIVLSLLVPTDFLALAYDSGGAAAGALVLPVILSFGVGMSSVLSDRTDLSDVFGYIALATMGPILGVLLMGVLLF